MADTKENQNKEVSADAQASKADASSEQKQYSEEHVKTLIKERDEAKKKLREVEKAQEEATQKIEAEKAQASGDYSKLVEAMQRKEQSWKKRVAETVLTSVASEYQLMDMDDIKLLDVAVDVDDDFEVKNLDDVKKAFTDFKAKKPYKFKTSDGKQVPPTDNTPFTPPGSGTSITLEDIGKMNREDFIKNQKAVEALVRKI
jgi:seryl-tRNA synthetase